MNQGEIIQSIRIMERELKVTDERLHMLEKKVAEMDEILKSPIRREIYAQKKRQQESSQSKHTD